MSKRYFLLVEDGMIIEEVREHQKIHQEKPIEGKTTSLQARKHLHEKARKEDQSKSFNRKQTCVFLQMKMGDSIISLPDEKMITPSVKS